MCEVYVLSDLVRPDTWSGSLPAAGQLSAGIQYVEKTFWLVCCKCNKFMGDNNSSAPLSDTDESVKSQSFINQGMTDKGAFNLLPLLRLKYFNC